LNKKVLILVGLIPEALTVSDLQIQSDIEKEFSEAKIPWCAELEKVEVSSEPKS
jgi:hypothetical protein